MRKNPTQIIAIEETTGLTQIPLYKNRDFSNEINTRKIISMYNQEAVKTQISTINPDQFIKKSKNHAIFSYKAILHAMDTDIYLKAKSGDIAGITKFKSDIVSNIDRGIPISWTVRTGIFEHREHIGKHRMLIVGYNLRENTMIYSDSRGIGGHKKHSIEKAWAISDGLLLCIPKLISTSTQIPNDNSSDDDDDDDDDDYDDGNE